MILRSLGVREIGEFIRTIVELFLFLVLLAETDQTLFHSFTSRALLLSAHKLASEDKVVGKECELDFRVGLPTSHMVVCNQGRG